jgi:hypothetical protein
MKDAQKAKSKRVCKSTAKISISEKVLTAAIGNCKQEQQMDREPGPARRT